MVEAALVLVAGVGENTLSGWVPHASEYVPSEALARWHHQGPVGGELPEMGHTVPLEAWRGRTPFCEPLPLLLAVAVVEVVVYM